MDNVLDLANLNTQNVTNMNAMFKDCNNINEADISNIEMSSVTDASNMFSGCNNLTKLTMTGVDTSNISNNTQLFDGCDNLKTIVIDNQTDLSGINSQILTNMNVRNIDDYFTEDERLLVKGNERITRDLKVQGNIFGDSNHKAFLPNIKSSSIELGDGVVRKIDKNAASGNVIYDAENEKFTTSNELLISGDLKTGGQVIAEGDIVTNGDLLVNGKIVAVEETQIATKSDYLVTRNNNQAAMLNTEHSGVIVNNYDGNGSISTITSDSTGEWRVSNTSNGTSTTFNNISNFNNVWYSELTQTIVEIPKGILSDANFIELDEVVFDDSTSSYYDKIGENYYGPITINTGKFDIGSLIVDNSVISRLSNLTTHDLLYYNTIKITTIDASQNQPLLTREEKTKLRNGDILVWDGINNKAVYLPRPTLSNQTLKSKITDGVVSYEWENNSYSLNEVATGKTWIDGKPIYRKVLQLMKNNVVINQPSNNVATVIELKPFFTYNSSQIVGNVAGDGYYFYIYWNGQVVVDSSNTNNTGYIIMEYTKTTD